MYVWWSTKLTDTQCCCPRATSCPIVRVRQRDGGIVENWHVLLPFGLSFSRGRLRLGAPVEKGHSVSLSHSWRLERSITIYMLIFDSSLLPDAHTLLWRYETLVLVLSRTERNLRMEWELTPRSHSQMFLQLLKHYFMSQGCILNKHFSTLKKKKMSH